MDVAKVLIADPETTFRENAAQALAQRYRVRCCSDGIQAMELVNTWQPDVLVTELVLPGLDGMELLHQLLAREARPGILVVTDLNSAFVHEALETLAVDYAMIKPCNLRSLVSRVGELLEPARKFDPAEYELEEILRELGFAGGRQGYQDLLVGIPMLARRRNQRLGKELYEAIALQNHSTAQAVEKAIRDTIRDAWRKGHGGPWQRLFPGADKCPQNKEFLFRLADRLRLGRKCG